MKNECKQPRNSLFFIYLNISYRLQKGRTVIRINRGKFNSEHMRRTLYEIESIRDFVWLIDWSIDKIVFINFLFEHKGTADRFIREVTLYKTHKLGKIGRIFFLNWRSWKILHIFFRWLVLQIVSDMKKQIVLVRLNVS